MFGTGENMRKEVKRGKNGKKVDFPFIWKSRKARGKRKMSLDPT